MQEWHRDLSAIRAALPCSLAQWRGPCLVFLPAWWPAQHGIWIYFSFIFIGPGLKDAPADARRYLLGHEYGHLYCGHVWLHYGYWLAVAGLLGGLWTGAVGLALAGWMITLCIGLAGVWPGAIARRECAADAVAVKAWGAHCAIHGASWFMGKWQGSGHHLRAMRLARLHSYLARESQ